MMNSNQLPPSLPKFFPVPSLRALHLIHPQEVTQFLHQAPPQAQGECLLAMVQSLTKGKLNKGTITHVLLAWLGS